MELKTSWWKQLLRFFRLINKREEFLLTFNDDYFSQGDIIKHSENEKLLILKKK
jgi:hypothetical protein